MVKSILMYFLFSEALTKNKFFHLFSGAIGARLSTDASSVKSLVGDTLALIVENLATVTTGVVIAFVANWKLALMILVMVPLVGLQGYAQMKFLHGFSADAKVT